MDNFELKCDEIALASPRFPPLFSKSIGFTLCGIVEEPTSPTLTHYTIQKQKIK